MAKYKLFVAQLAVPKIECERKTKVQVVAGLYLDIFTKKYC